MFNFFKKISSIWRIAIPACGIVAVSLCCQFSTDIPLSNSTPKFIGDKAIERTVFFPDEAVCTLQVEDLNGSRLEVSSRFVTDSVLDSLSPVATFWPGSIVVSTVNSYKSNYYVSLHPEFLGFCTGTISMCDRNNDSAFMPVRVNRIFMDRFNSSSFDSGYWKTYCPNDPNMVFEQNAIMTGLKFTFSDTSGDSAARNKSYTTGMRSGFRLGGDFQTSVAFQLRDDMKSGFEIAFFVSTSPDTGLWVGEVGGIYLAGVAGMNRDFVQLMCNSVFMQTASSETESYSGKLLLSRTGSLLTFNYYSGKNKPAQKLASFSYPAASSVYIHFRMKVDDRTRNRHCLWKDFEIAKGMLSF